LQEKNCPAPAAKHDPLPKLEPTGTAADAVADGKEEEGAIQPNIFEVGEINAIRSRAFLRRQIGMAGSFVAGGVAQPPAAGEGLKLVGRSLPRGPSGKAARKLGARARSGSLFLVGT